jgi:heme exporter protein B
VRDVKLALRSRAELGVQLLFYVLVASLFPLAMSPERATLALIGPGVLWVAALLASLLSLPRLFAADYADGTLEQIALSPHPLVALVGGKIIAHWLTTGLPLVAIAPLVGLQYAMDEQTLTVLAAALLIGTPILSLLGAIGAALTLGLRGSGSLLALLILPLYVPVLVFGAGAVRSGAHGARCVGASVAARRGPPHRVRRRARSPPPPPCELRSTRAGRATIP